MRFGHYFETSAENLREFNRKHGKGFCDNCRREKTVIAVYCGYVCNDVGNCGALVKARGYHWECSACGCTFGEPFKIYFNDSFAD